MAAYNQPPLTVTTVSYSEAHITLVISEGCPASKLQKKKDDSPVILKQVARIAILIVRLYQLVKKKGFSKTRVARTAFHFTWTFNGRALL